jgi:predicted Zn-dependent protease
MACATNPVTGRREFTLMSEAQEIALGKESDPQIREEMGLYDDAALQRYVSDIGQRMARTSERPDLPWQFAVVDQPAVNAFAVPGGFIYVTRGILPFLDNEAELAGVLGHEIGHVTARHSVQQYTRAVGGTLGLVAVGIFVPAARPFGQLSETALAMLFLRYGREDELQSDQLGARYAAATGWDPTGVPAFLTTLGRLDAAAGDRRGVPNWLSTHPDPLSRVDEVRPLAQQLAAGRTLTTNRDEFTQRMDGLMFGDNPAYGVIRESSFLHPVLRFRVDFPMGYQVSNSPQQVVAKAPNADAYMILQLVPNPQRGNIREVATGSMQGAGLTLVQGDRERIGGFDAFMGVYQGTLEGLGPVTMRAAHIPYNDNVYMVGGLTPPDGFRRADGGIAASIRSFRAMSANEADAIRPSRVSLYVVRAGDTWQSLAARSDGGISAAALAVMNNMTPGSPPQTGARIKVVVAG